MSLAASIKARTDDDGDRIARLHRARVGTFACAGALGVLRGAIGYRHPTYWAPTTTLDWTAVVTFTAFLLAAACSLLVLAHDHRGATRLAFALAAFGSALAGAGNALEDGAGVAGGGYAFAAGILVMVAGLLAAGILGLRPSGRPRWLGPLLFANIAVLAISFDTLGLALFGATWVVLAVSVGLGSRRPGSVLDREQRVLRVPRRVLPAERERADALPAGQAGRGRAARARAGAGDQARVE